MIYVDENSVRVINSTGTFDYTYVKHNGQLIAQVNPDGSKYFIHGDHLGSVSVVTDEEGNVIENTTYSPHGLMLTGGSVSRYGYESMEYDSVVGDTDFHFRKYNAEWGLFTQPDTIVMNFFNPQNLNKYSFEYNNPFKYTDPTGKKVKDYSETRYTEYTEEIVGGAIVRRANVYYDIIYQATGEGGTDGKTTTQILTSQQYNTLSNAADRMSDTPYASLSFGRNMYNEYMVSFLTNGQYEPRGWAQRLVQNKYFQGISSTIATIATLPIGGTGGGALAGTYAWANIEEMKGAGHNPSLGDFAWAYGDVFVSMFGAKLLKTGVSSTANYCNYPLKTGTGLDIAAEVSTSVGYYQIKEEVYEQNE